LGLLQSTVGLEDQEEQGKEPAKKKDGQKDPDGNPVVLRERKIELLQDLVS